MTPGGWWRRYLDWRQRNVCAVVSDQTGFDVTGRGQRHRMRWTDIVRIVAFKRDLLTYDLLCIAIEGGDGIVEVDEEMSGYADFEHNMSVALALPDEWKLRVLFPAFEANVTPVFVRAVA